MWFVMVAIYLTIAGAVAGYLIAGLAIAHALVAKSRSVVRDALLIAVCAVLWPIALIFLIPPPWKR